MTVDLEAELDRLYQGPASAFVAARNLLVKALRGAGDHDAAGSVARLARPTPVAWMINQLRFQAPELLGGLREAGLLLRHAQEAGADGGEIAGRRVSHREALHLATERALALAEGGPGTTGAALRRRVELTLTLLSASVEDVTPPPGRMSVELEPLGFDAFTRVAVAAAPKAPPRASPTPDEAAHLERLAAVKAALSAAERALQRMDREVGLRQAAHEAAIRDVTDAEARLTSARAAASETRGALEAARTAADSARRAVEEARTALEALSK